MTIPPLPKPFTNLPCAGSVTTSITVWTSDAMEAYGAACAAAEREEIERLRADLVDMSRLYQVHKRAAAENDLLRAASVMARTALSDLIASGDPKVYSDALNALDAALRD